jgi:signal transduction histidine kinase
MLRLIEDILELCNIQSGTLQLNITTTNLQPLINRAMLLSQPVAERKKVRIELEGGGKLSLPPVQIDPVRMVHALESLITSLVKLARPGSTIEVAAGVRLGRATIGLRSEGFAVSAPVLRLLFNPFRSRAGRQGVEGGTALALATAKQIIAAHGGVLRIEAGAGSSLSVKLGLPLPAREAIRKRVAGAP